MLLRGLRKFCLALHTQEHCPEVLKFLANLQLQVLIYLRMLQLLPAKSHAHLQREDLSPIEEALGYKALIDEHEIGRAHV